MELEEFLRKAANKEQYEARIGGAAEQEIRNLEASLAVTLPPTYRRFLSLVGFVSWFGTEVFGITGDRQNDTFLRTKLAREHALNFRDQLFQVPRYGNII